MDLSKYLPLESQILADLEASKAEVKTLLDARQLATLAYDQATTTTSNLQKVADMITSIKAQRGH